ncbi:cellulose synthase/poly-beta-1,6-N-acetylglucosamine synthase-like glycosyltransferase [Ilumatobacter fluminis]|uniref:Cellulose synthase/poly-beta-1,6-N-acetylglucosamine synthase-like glycosyltransferase n=1 Tax=Ilumatobacter fluminis TaxID=467091 RepID=A0A4R7I2S9_9ACTN|nr:cellulose synthase/poly-beta-1,6-N-acetylglucosamine synthase-like glycosyltransferase [Ilumatobacter fluminis]
MGVFVLVVVAGAAALLWYGAARWMPEMAIGLHETAAIGTWNILYDAHMPSITVIVAALGIAVLAAVGVAVAERVVNNRARRSVGDPTKPLSPRTVLAETRGEFHGEVTVTVLIPAHNEQASIGATLDSLLDQTRPPERIVVVADNCTDDTVAVATRHGAEVFETVGNTEKKAGALNQALAFQLDELGENDCVLVVDADTILDPAFIEVAANRMTADRGIMAVGGLFYGEERRGLLAQLQRNEYLRYSRELERRRGRVFVLTGTASMFRPRGLRTVAAMRGALLPGPHGKVYDTTALTEDNELTLALKTLGGLMWSPSECRVVTELMPKWRHLWNQRLRWQRGALENLGAYGFRSSLVRYWAQQLGIGYSVIALSAFWLLIALTVLSSPDWVWYPFWLVIGATFVVDRVIGVWDGGWRARGLAALIFPELLYDLFLDVVYMKGVLDITIGRRAAWAHVHHPVDDPAPDEPAVEPPTVDAPEDRPLEPTTVA